MKTRRYTITQGMYDSYQIVAQVEGAANPALSTLYKRFLERAAIVIKPTNGRNEIWLANFNSKANGMKTLRDAGYEGHDFTALFIDWLVKEHGFTVLKSDEFWVED